MKEQFVKIKKVGGFVNKNVNIGTNVFFTYNQYPHGDNPQTAGIKIDRLVLNKEHLVISGKFSQYDFILNVKTGQVTRLGNDGISHHMLCSEITVKSLSGTKIEFDPTNNSFFYREEDKTKEATFPLVVGDQISNAYYTFDVLAIAGDGAVFIQRKSTNANHANNKAFKSSVLRISDTTSYKDFKDIKVVCQ